MDLSGVALIIAASASPIASVGAVVASLKGNTKLKHVDAKLTTSNGISIAQLVEHTATAIVEGEVKRVDDLTNIDPPDLTKAT